MPNPNPNPGLAAALALALLAAAPLGGAERPGEALTVAPYARADDPPAHCCFTNARYVGTCDVEPSAAETCASILEYLNNPQSQGKTYCGSTSVRGDWKAATCEAKPSGD